MQYIFKRKRERVLIALLSLILVLLTVFALITSFGISDNNLTAETQKTANQSDGEVTDGSTQNYQVTQSTTSPSSSSSSSKNSESTSAVSNKNTKNTSTTNTEVKKDTVKKKSEEKQKETTTVKKQQTTKPKKQYYTYSISNYKSCVYGSNYTSKTYELINTFFKMIEDIDNWDTNTKYSSVISNITKTDEQLFMSYIIENYGYVAEEAYVSVEYTSGKNGKIKVNKGLSGCIDKRDSAEVELNKLIKSVPKGTELEICECLAEDVADEINYTTGYHDIYDALINHRGVCDSYAKTFKAALDKIGIENDLIIGYVGTGTHSWNVVYIDGKKYYYDLTSYDSTHNDDKYLATQNNLYKQATLNNYYF